MISAFDILLSHPGGQEGEVINLKPQMREEIKTSCSRSRSWGWGGEKSLCSQILKSFPCGLGFSCNPGFPAQGVEAGSWLLPASPRRVEMTCDCSLNHSFFRRLVQFIEPVVFWVLIHFLQQIGRVFRLWEQGRMVFHEWWFKSPGGSDKTTKFQCKQMAKDQGPPETRNGSRNGHLVYSLRC